MRTSQWYNIGEHKGFVVYALTTETGEQAFKCIKSPGGQDKIGQTHFSLEAAREYIETEVSKMNTNTKHTVEIMSYRGQQIFFNVTTLMFFTDSDCYVFGAHNSMKLMKESIDSEIDIVASIKKEEARLARIEKARLARMNGTYFMVHARDGGASSIQHPTRDEAVKEAARLAKHNPGKTFDVLECTAAVYRVDTVAGYSLSISCAEGMMCNAPNFKAFHALKHQQL